VADSGEYAEGGGVSYEEMAALRNEANKLRTHNATLSSLVDEYKAGIKEVMEDHAKTLDRLSVALAAMADLREHRDHVNDLYTQFRNDIKDALERTVTYERNIPASLARHADRRPKTAQLRRR
jgi:predicted RNase H-like nuclease (RuvC/YqgF family)